MSIIARTAQMKQQISIDAAYSSTTVEARHTLCTAPPAFPTDNVEYEESPNYCNDFEAIGEVTRKPGYGEHTIEFERLTLADTILLAELAMAGGKTPSGAGPYVWTHNSADTGDLGYLIAEVGVALGSSGTNFIKTLQNGQAENLEIMIDSEASFMTATLKARGDETAKIASFSATESVSHSSTKAKNSWVQLFLDDTPGAIGTTEITCNRLNAKLTLDNKMDSVLTDCGPKQDRGRRFMQLELRFLLDTTSDDEYVDWSNETTRYVRLKATDPSTGEYWQMDFVGVFQTYDHGEAGPFQDLTLVAKSQRDDTLGYSWQQVVSHDDAASLDYYNL